MGAVIAAGLAAGVGRADAAGAAHRGRPPAASCAIRWRRCRAVRPVAAPAGSVPPGDRGAGARPAVRRAARSAHRLRRRSRHRRAGAVRRRRARRSAGGRALRHAARCRCISRRSSLVGRRCGDGGLRGRAAARGGRRGGGRAGGRGGRRARASRSCRRRRGPVPPLVRAHDEAVGILMAAHTAAQLAAWRATPGRPPLAYVRPRVERNATFRVERMRQYARGRGTRRRVRGAT